MRIEPSGDGRHAPQPGLRPDLQRDPHGGWRARWDRDWRAPSSLTVLLPTAARDGAIVDTKTLRQLMQERESTVMDALARVEGLHALRIVVVPDDNGHGPRLLINSISDDFERVHRARVAQVLWPHVHDLLAGAPERPEALEALLERHHRRDNTLFHASPGVSLVQIRAEARLRAVLRAWADSMRASGRLQTLSLEEARLAARAHVVASADETCAREPTPRIGGRWRRRADLVAGFLVFPMLGVIGKDLWLATRQVRSTAKRCLATLALGVWWLYAAPFTALAFLGVRLLERIEPDVLPPPASDEKLDLIEIVEDGRTKNELTIWFPVRPTRAGRLMMWLILFGAGLGTRHAWTRGTLAGAQNIHFARLLTVDRGTRMIFMSDYEGSFDAYIDHFIGVGGHTRAVVPISSRVEGCPKTRWLFWAADIVSFRQRWREMVRSYQLQASVRYVAYPLLSANDIIAHREIRDGLFAARLSPQALERWARRI
ncbi:MAG: hypothetical protein M3Q42_13485 [Pseudomonadota bacterium]|nr:hypothetical protein [Pseudomonadota bacterium]